MDNSRTVTLWAMKIHSEHAEIDDPMKMTVLFLDAARNLNNHTIMPPMDLKHQSVSSSKRIGYPLRNNLRDSGSRFL